MWVTRTVALAALLGSGNLALAQADVADAAMQRDNSRVASLLQEGADVNAGQADGATALHWAAYHGDAALAELLLEAGAEIAIVDPAGASQLVVGIVGSRDNQIRNLQPDIGFLFQPLQRVEDGL